MQGGVEAQFRLPGGKKQLAQQLLSFPLTDGRRIADSFCELFGEHPSGFAWLRMIEFEALGDGWASLVREVQRFYDRMSRYLRTKRVSSL